MLRQWYQKDVETVAAELKTDLGGGLAAGDVSARLKADGYNELQERPRDTLARKFLNQFRDVLVLILVAACGFSLLIGEVADSLVILAIVILNAVLGVVQENKAEKALEALKKMAAPNSKAVRDGVAVAVPSRELVVGDVVLLEAGDLVPADIRLTEAANLKVEEASLTGESVPVEKAIAAIVGDTALADRHNMVYMSSTVTYGRGRGIVVATGMATEVGGIAEMLAEFEEEATPLQKNLARFGKILGGICMMVCAVIFAMGIYKGFSDGSLSYAEVQLLMMTAVSLAVAAIPEGLPAIVTVVLALGMQRMVKKNSLIRRLHAVETLGSTTVICSDKTGTLTQNQMTVTELFVAGESVRVSGEGYNPAGVFSVAGQGIDPQSNDALAMLLKGGVLCSDASLRFSDDAGWAVIGDPTEGALVVAAAKGGYGQKEMNEAYPRLRELPFDSERKLMTTCHAVDGRLTAFVKGAPDVLLARCGYVLEGGRSVKPITDAAAQVVRAANGALADRALRVLAVGYREFAAFPDDFSPDSVERELVFVGLLGMIDPPRPEARAAVAVCNEAGIRPIMITGDNPATAFAVAKELGIAATRDEVVTGSQLDETSAEELRDKVRSAGVFARVSPVHKVAIVEALRSNGEIVAMTGDGVNDAPALKRADIGVAMGITGTDVTKETADMVLTDDNFASIVLAVEEGRVIFANIRKCVFFLLSCNLAEIMIIFFAMLLGWPIPLLPIHLLWLNLVTDAFPAFALGMENREPDVMKVAPRDPREALINKNMRVMIGIQSSVMTIAVLGAFRFALSDGMGLDMARTVAFVTLIASELLRAYSSRSERYSIFSVGLLSNKYMNVGVAVSFVLLLLSIYSPLSGALKTVFVGPGEWALIAGFGVLPFVAGEAGKLVLNAGGRAGR